LLDSLLQETYKMGEMAMDGGGYPGPLPPLLESGGLVVGPGGKKEGGRAAIALPKLSTSESLAIQRAKKYAMEQSIKIVLMKQTLAHQQAQAKSLQRQQAIVLMCRIYVGSINFEVREDTLKTTFGPFGPIKSISMSWDPLTQKHKGFAFIDYETPEAAQLALEQMNGTFISGRNIKVGRPSNMPQAQTIIEEIQRDALNYNRVYVGGIHKDLSTEDIKSVFEAFGQIKTCELAPTLVEGRHKGYGFIEYENLQSCQDAISSMNQFDLGGQYLRVGRSITPPDIKNTGGQSLTNSTIPTASAVAAAAVTAKIQALDAVATNLGLDSQDIKMEQEKEDNFQLEKRRKEKEEKQEKREKERERERDDRSRELSQPHHSRSRDPSPKREDRLDPAPPPPAGSPPADRTSPPPPLPISVGADKTAATQVAMEQAQQLELQKKLMSGSESTTLSQQENMQIKGQSARHLVMQKLMGARGGLRESKILCLKNMVGSQEVDEQLQEEIEEECSKYGDVENVIIYQERQSEEEDAEILVKIFVEFGHPSHAKKGRDSLNGRFFGGRTVVAQVYDQVLYEEQDFSH